MSRIDSAALTIDGAPADVYRVLVDPEARTAWLPPSGMAGHFERWVATVGGGYRMVLTYLDVEAAPGKSTADADVVDARFLSLDPGERIVEAIDFDSDDAAFAGTMTMTWTLVPDGSGTLVTITADDVPPGIDAADHEVGLRASLDQLADYVRGRRSP